MMFENLTARERILAWIVLSLVPICILFFGIFWFIGRYNDNNAEFMSLTAQVSDEEAKQNEAIRATQRRRYFRDQSLPSNVVKANNDYQLWLKNLLQNEIQMELKSVTPRQGSILKHNNRAIGQSKTFTVLATADLAQLTRFLHEFYSLPLLHRINSLKINPQSTGSGGKKKSRTGKLSLIMQVEALSLVDADEERDFASTRQELARSFEDYQSTILRRNIFGPSNNVPTISVRPSSSYTSETDLKIRVTGNDSDSNDELQFELIESSVEGSKLSGGDGRSAFLEIPGQAAGEYKFKVAVADNGFPPKTNEQEFTVRFKDRVVVKPPPPPPPKPKFQHATETRITGIVKDVTGNWQVWIKVRTTGERFTLNENETFELDETTWKVSKIEPNQVTFERDDQPVTLRPSVPFSANDKKAE